MIAQMQATVPQEELARAFAGIGEEVQRALASLRRERRECEPHPLGGRYRVAREGSVHSYARFYVFFFSLSKKVQVL